MNIRNDLPDSAILSELGNRIAVVRVQSRMTQSELARRAGVSKRSLERLEKGEGGVRLQIVIAVARALRCLDALDRFIPIVPLSPYDIAENIREPVKRVRVRKRPDRPFEWKE